MLHSPEGGLFSHIHISNLETHWNKPSDVLSTLTVSTNTTM